MWGGAERMRGCIEQEKPAMQVAAGDTKVPERAKRRRAGVSGHARRPPLPPRHLYENGRLRIDFDAYEVFVDGQRVDLLVREFELLRLLVQHPNRVFSRTEILRHLWGRRAHVDPRTINVHVRRLRMRIERDDARPELLVTVRRVGYKFEERGLLSEVSD
jgi:DNA-binding response OmpR family regulator